MQNAVYLDIFFVLTLLFLAWFMKKWNEKNNNQMSNLRKNPYYPMIKKEVSSLSFPTFLLILIFCGIGACRLMEIFVAFDAYGMSAIMICLIFFVITTLYANLTAYRILLLVKFTKKIEIEL